MTYQVNQPVVHAAYGVGRVVRVATQRFMEHDAQPYYEVAIQRNTIWVPVGDSQTLRPLTTSAELPHYRKVLSSLPAPLADDHRQRRQEVQDRLKLGRFQDMCEIVRDLASRGWKKPLNEMDSGLLRRTRTKLCQEWAAAAGLTEAEAIEEVGALLGEGRKAYAK